MAKVNAFKNKGCALFLNEKEKEYIRALLGAVKVDDPILKPIYDRLCDISEYEYKAVNTCPEPFMAALSIKRWTDLGWKQGKDI